jgi:hypothetical protein
MECNVSLGNGVVRYFNETTENIYLHGILIGVICGFTVMEVFQLKGGCFEIGQKIVHDDWPPIQESINQIVEWAMPRFSGMGI